MTLRGHTRPEANAENDRGALKDSHPLQHIWLQMRQSPATREAMTQYVSSLSNPASPNYHKWMSPAEFSSRFGPDPQDVATVKGWLESNGMTVNHVYSNGVIDFSGTAGAIRQAFHTEIHHLTVDGVNHFGNMRDPEIPAAIAPAVAGLVSLHNFFPHHMHSPRANFASTDGYQAVVPADLATIYNLNAAFKAGITGRGQTIAAVEDTNLYNNAEFTIFRKIFGLSLNYPYGTLTTLHPQPGSAGNCDDPGVNGDDGEAAIDVQWASAAAPNAHIWLISCADTDFNFGGFIAMENILDNGGQIPNIISISYGESEVVDGESFNLYIDELYAFAAAEGVSVFVSSGDEGAASSDANRRFATHGITTSALTTTQWNVSVGGTDYGDLYQCLVGGTCSTFAGSSYNATYWNATNTAAYGSAKSYVPEVPWNDSCASVLIATLLGKATTYGSTGACNTSPGSSSFLTTASGSGGPSTCFTGTPTIAGVTSGTCAGYPKPSWQNVLGNPSDGVRDIPDVSLFAANGVFGHYYVVCYTDPAGGGTPCVGNPTSWAGFGGTSVSTPIVAGMQALVNQHTGVNYWGNTAPVFYQMARNQYGAGGDASCNSTLGNGVSTSCVFYDVTLGDIDVPCRTLTVGGVATLFNCYRPSGTNGVLSTSNSSYQPAYGTTVGWDFATGIGTINAYNLVMNWPTGP
ncbi:MAG TPA: S53 family peptidase [Candidatus Acidoferrales bacterium]|nr:S53 family peptidase [Candidatus Acidoferrales bacterium]